MPLLVQLVIVAAVVCVSMVVLDVYVSTQTAMVAAMRYHRSEWLSLVPAAHARSLMTKRLSAGVFALVILTLGWATSGLDRGIAAVVGVFAFLAAQIPWNAWAVWQSAAGRKAG